MTHQERLDGLYGTSRRRLSEHVDGILETYVKDFEVCGDYGIKMYLRGNAAGLEAENYIKEALGSAADRSRTPALYLIVERFQALVGLCVLRLIEIAGHIVGAVF